MPYLRMKRNEKRKNAVIAKKKPPPIRSYKNFFKALRLCHDKYGFEFEFHQTNAQIFDDNGYASTNAIWHRSQSSALWNPVEVVHYVFYATQKEVWMPASMAYQEIGLPHEKYTELVLAYREARGHYTHLRERLCDALGLEEVPVNERSSYRVVEDLDKRRR